MTTMSRPAPAIRTIAGGDRSPFLGFGTFLRKEFTDWLRSRRAIVVGIVASIFATLGALSAWLEKTFGDISFTVGEAGDAAESVARVDSTDPTITTLALFGPPIVAFLAIVATMSLFPTERDTGTLAWSLTKPLSRTSIVFAKLLAAIASFGVVAVAIPIAFAGVASTLAYGGLPDVGFVATTTALYLSVPILYIGITVAAGTVLSSQAGIAGVAMFVLLVPSLFGGFLPPVVMEALPMNIGAWVTAFVAGAPVPWTTPVAWAATVIGLAIIAVIAFRRREF
jgi:ABC-type transport system involved in multi-copper enzyme maturation permease subunit